MSIKINSCVSHCTIRSVHQHRGVLLPKLVPLWDESSMVCNVLDI